MSQLPALPPESAHSRRAETARQLEAQAGSALTTDFWYKPIETPFGAFSRRALLIVFSGCLLFMVLFGSLIWVQITAIPSNGELPDGNAATIMTHIYANFNRPKDPEFVPFVQPADENWRFEEGYTFNWVDNGGASHQVVLLSYDSQLAIYADYYYLTRYIDNSQHNQVVAQTREMTVELRSVPAFDSLWVGLRWQNMLLLLSPDTPEPAQQVLFSHFTTIMAANHRDQVPTATPFR